MPLAPDRPRTPSRLDTSVTKTMAGGRRKARSALARAVAAFVSSRATRTPVAAPPAPESEDGCLERRADPRLRSWGASAACSNLQPEFVRAGLRHVDAFGNHRSVRSAFSITRLPKSTELSGRGGFLVEKGHNTGRGSGCALEAQREDGDVETVARELVESAQLLDLPVRSASADQMAFPEAGAVV